MMDEQLNNLIAEFRDKQIAFEDLRIVYSKENSLDLLKLIVYQKIKRKYWAFVQQELAENINWVIFSYNGEKYIDSYNTKYLNGSFDKYFSKYPIDEFLEENLRENFVFKALFPINEEQKIFIKENIGFENQKMLNILKGNRENLFCSYPEPIENFTSNLNSLKNAKNNFSGVHSCFSEKPILFDLISGDYSYSFYGGEFLKNIGSIKYNDFRNFTIANNLNVSEIFYLIFNLKNLNPRNRIEKIDISESEKINDDFNKSNEYEKEVIETIQGNYAKGKILKILNLNGETLESEFTDFQAFHICKGLQQTYYPLYNKYLKKIHTDSDTFRAHQGAMKTLQKHGRVMIEFLLSLPELPFKCAQFKILFSTLDKAKDNGNINPSVKLIFKNSNKQNEEISFSFVEENEVYYKNMIRVYKKGHGEQKGRQIMSISREGVVIPKDYSNEKKLNVTPIIELFYRITENENGYRDAILSYGVETGKCSLCGRDLTDKISKIKGIGPVCEKYLN